MKQTADLTIDRLIRELLAELAVSRVTVRLEDELGHLPVTQEALDRGVNSIKDEDITVVMRRNPIIDEVLRGNQVVQNDCTRVSLQPDFVMLLERYGGLHAQVITPLALAGKTIGILSVHQIKEPRVWSEHEIILCLNYAQEISRHLDARAT